MPITLADLAATDLHLSFCCRWCGRRAEYAVRLLANRHGAIPLGALVERARCQRCNRAAAEVMLMLGGEAMPDWRHSPRFAMTGAFFQIDAWPLGAPVSTIVAGTDLQGMRGAWDALKDRFPDTEMTLRQGTLVLMQRGPLPA